MRNKIFKEPEGGRRAWIFMLIAGYFFVETVFFREAVFDRLVYLIFGIAVLGFGLAELVPRDRTGLAGAFRIGGVALMLVVVAVRALQLAGFPG